jgi:hypothetical protein
MKKVPIWVPIGCAVIVLAAIGLLLAGYLRGRALREELLEQGWDVDEYQTLAHKHAVAWHADAVLDTLRADRVDAKGHAQLGPNDHLELRFRSPSLADKCALDLAIREQSAALTAEIVEGACTPAPVPAIHCRVADVMQKVLARGARAGVPANVSLAHGAWHVEQDDLRFDLTDDCR